MLLLAFPALAYSGCGEKETEMKTSRNPDTEKSTPIIIPVGETKIRAVLSNSKTAKDLLSCLPYTIKLICYEYKYCCLVDKPFAYDASQAQQLAQGY